MKKIVLATAAVLAVAAFAYASPTSIVGSRHDMTVARAGAGPNEICVYCHTPHNAYRNAPLWNRVDPSPQQLYQSPSLSPAAAAATFDPQSVSGFCMSCHDGVTKIGAIKNTPVAGQEGTDAVWTVPSDVVVGQNYAGLGNDGQSLKNDHPINFSYVTAQGVDKGLAEKTVVEGKLNKNGNAIFFGPNKDQMECASCHAVHTPGTSYNFLRIENTGSDLCLACHVK